MLYADHGGNLATQLSGCAWRTAFQGHIEITGPNGQVSNSTTKEWPTTLHYCQNGDVHYSATFNAVVGKYCVTAWEGTSAPLNNYGTACENVE